ncbi:MAG: SRPBCC family protein [Pseudohongiellaceae bacterium]|nr:MAG: hypothetical protein A3H44_09345 [Gammaproteobacteria bacterium RIFCSPLOWO2_02_FULL_57_10]
MTDASPIVIVVKQSFQQSAERVFDAWLDVKAAAKFMFATETGTMVKCEIDPRVGGGFVMTDRRPEGEVEHTGTYLTIDRPHRLVFTFGIPAFSSDVDLVTVEITPLSRGCDLTLTTEMNPQWAEYEELAREGWTKILASLAATLNH